MCKPEFIEDSEVPYLELRSMRHPCVVVTGKSNFIPNDTVLNEQ